MRDAKWTDWKRSRQVPTTAVVAWRAALAAASVAILVASTLADMRLAYADSTTWNKSANCDNWSPHDWADLSWTGAPGNANVSSSAELYEWDSASSSYVIRQDSSEYRTTVGTSGVADSDAYEATDEQGTGTWQAIESYEYYHDTVLQASNTHYDYPWCG